MEIVIGVAGAVALLAAVAWFFVRRSRRNRMAAGAGLLCVTSEDFFITSPQVKAAAERAFAGTPKLHPIVTQQGENGTVLVEAGEYYLTVGRIVEEADPNPYGLVMFYPHREDGLGINEAYIALGKLMYELLPPGAARLLAPHLGRETELSEELKANLKAGDFAYAATFYGEPWLVEVNSDSKELKAAVAEARTRWPEFVEAFQGRDSQSDVTYAVKLPLLFGGETEFIWVEVRDIVGEQIRGELLNDSMFDKSVKAGHGVSGPTAEVNDWMISSEEEMRGGFTIPVLLKQS